VCERWGESGNASAAASLELCQSLLEDDLDGKLYTIKVKEGLMKRLHLCGRDRILAATEGEALH